jgi:membrane fusion protein, multidrug efflux system
MKKKALLVAALVILLAAGCGAYFVGGYRHLEKTDNAYIKADSIVISPKISGYVAEVAVGDNQFVAAGQPLLRIEPGDYQARLEQYTAAVASRQAALVALGRQKVQQLSRIAEAEAQLASVTAQMEKATAEYRRDKELVDKGFATVEQAEASLAASRMANSALARARAELAAARNEPNILNAQEVQLKADLQQSEAAAKVVQIDLRHATIVAPASGYVGNKTAETGQYVRAGSHLMTIVPEGRLYVVANFKETQVRDIRSGQRAVVSIDAMPGTELDGTVESIAPATGSEFSLLPPENAVGNFTKIVQRVPVRIALSEPAARSLRVRPGMSVVVAVDTRSTHDNASRSAQAQAAEAAQAAQRQSPSGTAAGG